MRVRVTKKTTAYWNYAVQAFEEGMELEGDLARLLADSAPEGSVEILEADPVEPEDESEPTGDDPAGGDGDDGDEPPAELNIDGTAQEVLAWVGDDEGRAAEALAAEQARDRPRSTLVKSLQKIAEGGE